MYANFDELGIPQVRKSVKSSKRRTSPSVLNGLPLIDENVPFQYISPPSPVLIKSIYQAAQYGLINETDRQQQMPLQEIFKNACLRRFTQLLGQTHCIDIDIELITSESNYLGDLYEAMPEETEWMVLRIHNAAQFHIACIGGAIAKLNLIHPDLGETMYAILENVNDHYFPIHTIAELVNRFSWELRYTEDSLEFEYMDDDEDSDTTILNQHELLTYLSQLPFDWVGNAKQKLTLEQLQQLHSSTQSVECQSVISAALDLVRMNQTTAKFPVVGYCPVHPLLILSVDSDVETDPVIQMQDDVIEIANECEDNFSHYQYQQQIDVSSAEAFGETFHQFEQYLQRISIVDRLIFALEALEEN
ncbi:hypothetical protein [Undibacterium oligocarboniphilum]|uniref:WAC domain-containing protein n=1 Tax=Undibacterium oligocarboniphilum TaxID=666702 RepID=A0A850QQ03_9BURK|nr:hypothetical protein [Undibacterium oligocarboniphilum]MBC3871777.1 hypothetical protein [Undibacterium oligocarboniphilum]NVO79413.1 hypothetical protein [Undibacterium oligocarboniphilum]